jgi:hypothetical protein
MGFRTSYEIELERNALKAMRGDYVGVQDAPDRATAALAAAQQRHNSLPRNQCSHGEVYWGGSSPLLCGEPDQ